MGVAMTLQDFLQERDLAYEIVSHTHVDSALRAAEAAHVPGDQVAKSVLLGDDNSYVLAVIPATYRLEVGRLNQLTARNLSLLTEDEIEATFTDCERGAIPPVGEAYGIETIVETDLTRQDAIYFESGDHKHMIKMVGEEFRSLMANAPRAHVSHHV